MDISSIIFIGFLCGFTVFKEIMHQKHVRELEEKLMARNLTEYKTVTAPKDIIESVSPMSAKDTLMDIDEADNPFSSDKNVRLHV